MTIYGSCQTHKFLKPCHVHIRVMSDSQIPKTFVMTIFVSCQTHKLLKTFVLTIYVSCQTHKFLKPCHVHIRIMSDSQIPKNIRHLKWIFQYFCVMSNPQIPKIVCHDHICAMSDSQIPRVGHPFFSKEHSVLCVLLHSL